MARPTKPYRMKGSQKEIHGLARDTDGRWRDVETGKKWSEPDEAVAVARFYQMAAEREGRDVVEVPVVSFRPIQPNALVGGSPASLEEAEFWQELNLQSQGKGLESFGDGSDFEVKYSVPLPGSSFWPYLRQLLLSKPELVRARTGVRVDLSEVKKEAVTLQQLADAYQPRKKRSAYRARREIEKLIKITGAETLDELTQETLVVYRKQMEKENPGPQTRRWLFGVLKSVLRNGKRLDEPLDAVQIDAALSRMECLRVKDPNPVSRPNPISRKNLETLLAAAVGDFAEWRAWILVALNCSLSIDETCAIEWTDIDLEKGTYYTIRSKTENSSVPRSAVLWRETLKVLKKIPRRGRFVFNSSHGTRWTAQARADDFRDFRRDIAGIPDAPEGEQGVSFQSLRDGAYTHAADNKENHHLARVLAGHVAEGYEDRYVSRHPEIVRAATDAVYRFYFGVRGRPKPRKR